MPAMLWQPALAAFVIALLCVKALMSETGRRLALDHPNERSLHERPVPRTGGLAIAAGVGVGWLVGAPGFAIALSLAAALAVLSFLDDLFGLPTAVRLAGHLGAAAGGGAARAALSGLGGAGAVCAGRGLVREPVQLHGRLRRPGGRDGAVRLRRLRGGGVACRTFTRSPSCAWCSPRPRRAFLVRNFPPARIFMGDVGSVPLGFLAGALGLIGWNDGVWPLWFPLLVFAPFVCDATLTLLRRLARGERVWQAHREHYYQRLVRMGFGHRGAALIEYAAMLACGAAAVYACRSGKRRSRSRCLSPRSSS